MLTKLSEITGALSVRKREYTGKLSTRISALRAY